MYNEGISTAGDVLDVGVEYGVITKKGHSYSYKDEKLGVGREKAKTTLRTNEKVMNAITKEVYSAVEESIKENKEEKDKK
jgi:recombination protein RecA